MRNILCYVDVLEGMNVGPSKMIFFFSFVTRFKDISFVFRCKIGVFRYFNFPVETKFTKKFAFS